MANQGSRSVRARLNRFKNRSEEEELHTRQITDVQCGWLRKVLSWDVNVVEKAHGYCCRQRKCDKKEVGTDRHRIPSSSEDFTLATITSEVKGRKTTILNTTTSCS